MARNPPPDVPERIKQLRARWGLSQQRFAVVLGVSEHSVIRWERGQTHPTPVAWQRLVMAEADGSHVQADWTRALRAPAERDEGAAVGGPPTNIPTHQTSFIGREGELEAARLRLGATRLLTLTGTGGGGKTRLALAIASAVQAGYADGAWLVELAPLANGRLVLQAVANVLGVREEPGRPLIERLAASLRQRQLLLVLDNCEHVLEACAQLVDTLLAICPEVRILATSREELALAGETVWRVPPLGLPEGVRLFVDRARARSRAFALTTSNAAAVEQICHHLDGLPLAIELAAARVPLLSAEQIAARLGERFRVLGRSTRTQPARHQTLRAAIDWSYDLLTPLEQAVFLRMGVFASGFDLEAAEAVGSGEGVPRGAVLDLLGRLVSQSLVVVEEHAGVARYRLLETLRAYALERLREKSEELDSSRGRHAHYYLALVEQAEPELYGTPQTVWLNRLDTEHDNLRQALTWGTERPDRSGYGLRLAGGLARFWLNRGYFTEGRRWLAEFVERDAGASAAMRAKGLCGAGTLAHFQGDHVRARALQEESLALYRGLGDKRGIAAALNNLGDVARQEGDYSEARVRYEESVALAREVGDMWRVAGSLHELGDVARQQGEYTLARTRYEECLAILRQLEDKTSITAALTSLGELAHYQGDQLASWTLHERALAMARQLGNTWGIALVLNNMADTARSQREYPRAKGLLAESLRLRWELGDRQGLARGLSSYAHVAAACRQWHLAGQLLGTVAALAEAVGSSLAPLYQDEYRGAEATTRDALGEQRFAAVVALGRALPLEEAVAYAVRDVTDDQPVATAPISRGREGVTSTMAPSNSANSTGLTDREREVLHRLAGGASNKEIGRAMRISPRTVERHVANLYAKIGARGRADAIAYALRREAAAPPSRATST